MDAARPVKPGAFGPACAARRTHRIALPVWNYHGIAELQDSKMV
jgi:hypothetical protein